MPVCPREEREHRSVLGLDRAPLAPEQGCELDVVQVDDLEKRAGAEQRMCGRCSALAGGIEARCPGLRQRQDAVDENEVGVRRRLGMVLLDRTEEASPHRRSRYQLHGVVLHDGHRMLVLPPPGKRGRHEPGRLRARAGRQAVKVERIGRDAGTPSERAHHRPGMTPVHRQVLAYREHRAAFGMDERRVVDVLAHVVLVHADGAVVREREVLRVHEIHGLRRGAGVLEGDVPEPRRGGVRQHERHVEADGVPFTAHVETVLVQVDGRRALRPEQRRRLDRGAVPAEIHVGGPAFDLGAAKERQRNGSKIHPPDGAVGVHQHGQAGGAPQMNARPQVCRVGSHGLSLSSTSFPFRTGFHRHRPSPTSSRTAS